MFDEEALEGLTDSVRELGVLQPVLVRAKDDGYELIAGERRWRAAKRAGLPTIPAVVRTTDDVSSLEQALVENLHRQDLNALEEAAAYQQLIEDFGLTQDQVAKRVGKSRSTVANQLRLFQLPPAVQKLVGEGLISAGHAKALLAHPDRSYQELLARRAVAESLSVRDLERLVKEPWTWSRVWEVRPTMRGRSIQMRPMERSSPIPSGSSGRRVCSSSRSCWPRGSTPGCRSR